MDIVLGMRVDRKESQHGQMSSVGSDNHVVNPWLWFNLFAIDGKLFFVDTGKNQLL